MGYTIVKSMEETSIVRCQSRGGACRWADSEWELPRRVRVGVPSLTSLIPISTINLSFYCIDLAKFVVSVSNRLRPSGAWSPVAMGGCRCDFHVVSGIGFEVRSYVWTKGLPIAQSCQPIQKYVITRIQDLTNALMTCLWFDRTVNGCCLAVISSIKRTATLPSQPPRLTTLVSVSIAP
jgi:hypothetical protein